MLDHKMINTHRQFITVLVLLTFTRICIAESVETYEDNSWWNKIINLAPDSIVDFVISLKNAFFVGLDIVYFIPEVLTTLFSFFVWTIKHMFLILMLFEVYVLHDCIARPMLSSQIATFLQKNIYAIHFIVNMIIGILTLGIRIINGITTTVTNFVPLIK